MKTIPALAGALAVFLLSPQIAGTQTYHGARHLQADDALKVRIVTARHLIVHYRTRTWAYQDARGARRSVTAHLERHVHALPRLRRLTGFWWHLAVRNRKAMIAARRVRVVTASAGHWALWDCIHNGAYPGAPHEGDSAGGTYSGYLQMTNPWEGRSGDWHAMGSGVYAIAEQAFLAHGKSIAWLEGQWPQTSPRCVRFAY